MKLSSTQEACSRRILPFVLLTCCVASASTYYVDPGGNDASSGTPSAPFRTVAKGVSAAAPGDTVILNNGTYGNEGHISDGTGGWNGYASPVSITKSGTSSAYITVKAANPGQAILDCGTTGSALGCDKYIVLYGGVKYWTFQGLVFTRGAWGGLGTDNGASYINVLNCQFINIGNWVDTTTIGEDGIGFDATATNWYINANIFHDIGRTGGQSYPDFDHGIYAKGTNVTITNNVFYNLNKGWSIQVANGATNWLIANNTFEGASAGNGQIMLWDTITNMTIQNNIFYNPVSYGIERYQATMSTCLVDHNLVYGVSTMIGDSTGCTVGNSMTGNPRLVSATAAPYNFQAQAGGAGIDAGVSLAAVPYDFSGITRPQGTHPDVGAYELPAITGPSISGVFTSGITTSSAAANWSTNQQATSYVQYGLTSSYSNTTSVNPSMVTSHSVSLASLAASTTYHYRVASMNSSGQTGYSPDATFTTASPPALSYSLSASSTSLSVVRGQAASTNITAGLLAGLASNVSFSASGLPAGVTASFSHGTCLPTCTTTMTLATTSATKVGSYSISVLGVSAQIAPGVTVTLNVTAPVSGNITSGLAAWWKFTEDSGNYAYDSSGNGNTATLYNPTWWTSNYGVTNWFSGSTSYASVKESASLELTKQFTVAFWLRPSANSNTDPRVISKEYDWDVKLNGSNRYPQFDAGGKYATLNYALPLITWNHVVFTFNNGVVAGYVNGVAVPMLANTFTSGSSIPNYAYGLFLAAVDSSLDNPYIGSLDDVRIYNRALSSADVAMLFGALPRLN